MCAYSLSIFPCNKQTTPNIESPQDEDLQIKKRLTGGPHGPSGSATGRSFSHPLRVLGNRAARVRLPSSRFHHLSSQRRSMATREYRSRVRAQRLQQALDYISAFWLSVCCYLICSQEEFKPGYVNYDPLYLVCMYSHSLVSHSIFFCPAGISLEHT